MFKKPLFRKLAVPFLATSIAFAGMAPQPALADNKDLGKIIVGVGLLALAAKAFHDNQQKREERARDVYVHRNVTPVAPPPAARQRYEQQRQQRYEQQRYEQQRYEQQRQEQQRQAQQKRRPQETVVRPVPTDRYANPIEVPRNLPAACETKVDTRDGKVKVLPATCLQNRGIWVAQLPQTCERIVDKPGNRNDQRAWSKSCLKDYGYRIQ